MKELTDAIKDCITSLYQEGGREVTSEFFQVADTHTSVRFSDGAIAFNLFLKLDEDGKVLCSLQSYYFKTSLQKFVAQVNGTYDKEAVVELVKDYFSELLRAYQQNLENIKKGW